MSVNPAEPRPRYKPYRPYKDSGVEWMGEIPAHWEVKRIKYVATKIGSGKTPSGGAEVYLNEGIMLVRSQNVHFGGLRLDDVAYIDEATDREMATTRVLENDVLLNITGASLGRCCLARLASRRANVNQHVCIIRPRLTQFDPSALTSALASDALQAQIFNNENGISRDALNFVQIGNFAVCKATLEEQRAITAFLDRETARIDGLVAKKERLIELLQEKRTALITRAVTKGLDPNVPMKDSGVEWLGEIPAHWEVKPLKAVSGLQTGITLGKDFEGRALTSRPYLRVANVQDGFLDLDDIAEIGLPANEVARHELRTNDVLMTEGGDFDKLGRGHVWEGQIPGCLHQNHIFAVRPRPELLRPYFLAHTMGSGYGRAYFTATSKQSTNLASTNSTKLGNLPLPLPSVAEQDRIVASIDQDTNRLDALIAKVRTAIDRLRELRTALISAAVTGKIDVRQESP
jgi:hypothetical protein